VQVAADLRLRIMVGEFGGILPSERVLRGQYGVSQPTLRAALLALDGEGLIIRRRGAKHLVRRAPESIIVYVNVSGPVEITAGVATDDERQDLELPVGAWVMRIWVLTADGDRPAKPWRVVPAATGRVILGVPDPGGS
jgi:DNA-binding transcriptional MocR family regulator